MEVGINRSIRFLQKRTSPDIIFASRKSTYDPSKDTSVEISVGKWHHWVKIESGLRDQMQELMRGNQIEVKLHLGGLMYLSLSSEFRCVQFRQHYIKEQNGGRRICPSKSGISMSFREFYYFLKHMHEFDRKLIMYKGFKPCYTLRHHSSSCSECFPRNQGMELEEF